MYEINQIFYYVALYIPLVVLIFRKTRYVQATLKKADILDKYLESESLKDTWKKVLVGWFVIAVIMYFVLGFFVAILSLFGAFSELREFTNPLYIINAFGGLIEMSLFSVVLFSIRFVCCVEQWGILILYVWLIFNVYNQLFGGFNYLDGMHYIMLPTLFY
jgi:hypothetical protein